MGRFIARFDGGQGTHVNLLIEQVYANANEELKLGLAQQMVKAKLKNSALVLARYERHRTLNTDQQAKVRAAIQRLREDRVSVKAATSLERLRGLEGQAARTYFEGFRNLLPKAWSFESRQRQPPPDPVNVMLSLGYTLLYHSVTGLLQARGFNPLIGFLHAMSAQHNALASDVMEEFRSIVVDTVVLDGCLNGKFKMSQFSMHEGGCTMNKEATRQFIHAYESKLGMESQWAWPGEASGADLRRKIDWQIMKLAQALHAQDASRYVTGNDR